MRGPFWNDKTGVTGEPNFRTKPENYVITRNDEGKVVTLVGEDAEAWRAAQRQEKSAAQRQEKSV